MRGPHTRYKTIVALDEKYGPTFYGTWTFFKIINSSYISWVAEESCEFVKPKELIHFVFLAMDSVVDIIASEEPKFELINK